MLRLPAIERLDLLGFDRRHLHADRACLRLQRLVGLKHHVPRLVRLHVAVLVALQRRQVRQVARNGVQPNPLGDQGAGADV